MPPNLTQARIVIDSRDARILLVSDTHGRVHPAILNLAACVDCVVHAGDVGGFNVLEQFARSGKQILAVRGNNDAPQRWPRNDSCPITGLVDDGIVSLPGGNLAVEHGHRANPAKKRHDLLRRRHHNTRLIVYGHSHRQIVDDDAEPWVVNPGAAGRNRTFGGAGCIVLTARGDDWRVQSHRFALTDWIA